MPRSTFHERPRLLARLALLASLTATTCGSSGRAFAADPPSARPPRTSSLSWIRLKGADDCVSTQDLARDVEGRLGRAVFVSPAQADISVEGHIEAAPTKGSATGWRATIIVRDAKGALLGTRTLERSEPSCTEMREPLALVVAVMIDPDAALREKPKPAEPPAKPETIVVVQEKPVNVPVPVPDPPPAPRWHFDGGASFITALGLLPGFGTGLYAGGLLEPPGFVPLQAFGAVWFDATESAGGPGRATFSTAFVGAGICPLRWRSDRLRAYGCANGHLGMITSRGEGFDLPQDAERRLHAAGALGGRLSLRVVGPLALRAGLSAAVPLSRDSFVYRRADGAIAEVFRMSPVVGLADLGFGVVLP